MSTSTLPCRQWNFDKATFILSKFDHSSVVMYTNYIDHCRFYCMSVVKLSERSEFPSIFYFPDYCFIRHKDYIMPFLIYMNLNEEISVIKTRAYCLHM